MLFLTPDEEGRISQANKVYDPPGQNYIDYMESLPAYLAVNAPGLISPDKWWMPDGTDLAERPDMPVSVSKYFIKAGGTDTVVFTGAPKNCDYVVTIHIQGVGDQIAYSGKLPDGELEIGMDMPCLFTVKLSKFPIRDFAIQIEATQ